MYMYVRNEKPIGYRAYNTLTYSLLLVSLLSIFATIWAAILLLPPPGVTQPDWSDP